MLRRQDSFPRRVLFIWLLLVCVVAGGITTALIRGRAPAAIGPPRSTVAVDLSNKLEAEESEHGPPFDWEKPVRNPRTFSRSSEATAFLAFAPTEPRFPVGSKRVLMNEQTEQQRNLRGLAFVYEFEPYGHVVVYEQLPPDPDFGARLLNLAGSPQFPGFRAVAIRGVRGIAGGWGTSRAFAQWIEGGVHFSVYVEDGNVAHAVQLAESI